MNKGKFITIDGVEGAGKSTQIDLVCEHLIQKGIKVVRTREPVSYTHLRAHETLR